MHGGLRLVFRPEVEAHIPQPPFALAIKINGTRKKTPL